MIVRLSKPRMEFLRVIPSTSRLATRICDQHVFLVKIYLTYEYNHAHDYDYKASEPHVLKNVG